MYKASLIISFYKKFDFLQPVIDSLEIQTENDFEVIISDDGSPENVVNEVKERLVKSQLNFQYVWHDDKGWRKNKILNKSVVKSKSDFLIFIDGDCPCGVQGTNMDQAVLYPGLFDHTPHLGGYVNHLGPGAGFNRNLHNGLLL